MKNINKFPFQHFSFEQNLDMQANSVFTKIHAQVVDMTDNAIVEAIVKYAREAGVNNLYLIDKEFIRTAIEKQIPKKATSHKVEAPKISFGNTNWRKGTTIYKCPCCGTFISYCNYCNKCGQKLLWENDT